MPSHKSGKSMPGFLGGSDLAVPAQSNSQAQARAWIADFTNTANEKALQAVGNIPNATNLLNDSVNDRAAKASWFVPTAKHWVDVENGNILRTMLGQILTGQLSVKKAAQTADANIAVHPQPVVVALSGRGAHSAGSHRRGRHRAASAAPARLAPGRRRLGPVPPHRTGRPRPRGGPRVPDLLPRPDLARGVRALRSSSTAPASTSGSANFSSVLHDPVFWHTLLRTVVFTAVNVGLTIVGGTLIALLLKRLSTAVRILLTVGLILVWAMPPVVAVQVWIWMTNVQNGVLNYILTDAARRQLRRAQLVREPRSRSSRMAATLIVWGALPFVVITVYAALSQVPHELVEAAQIDGARVLAGLQGRDDAGDRADPATSSRASRSSGTSASSRRCTS